MTSLFALRAILFAGGLLTGSLVIVALGWLGSARKTASARHLAWTAVTGALLALPLLALALPSLIHIYLPAVPAAAALPEPMSDSEFLVAQAQLAAAHTSAPAPAPAPAPSGFDFDLGTLVLALGVLWLLGACVVALRFAAGALFLAALERRSRPFALAPEDEPRIAARAQECELRLSDREAGPLTWGIFRPIVLLPRSALSWPRERMQAVLLHELAHIRRRDSLTLTLSQAACALYWPNPLVWMAARQLRREAEIAADDYVITSGIKPSHYAGELVALARTFKPRGPAFANLAVSMAAPGALEARVKSLLSETQARTGVTTMDVMKIAGAGFLAATALALACPSLAQETQPPQDQVVVDAPVAP
ncbi:MAG TPA: M56 family metallopeptidase, partial [Rhizomicrobium sp.]|nr:M56 family metallopeptidase [Rhizomicrobium sp.]